MASTQVQYSDLKQYLRDNLWSGFTEMDDRRFVEAIKGGLKKASRARLWSFMRQEKVVQTKAPISFTATIAVGATTLTAGSAVFTVAADVVGQYVELNGELNMYRIASRTSDTVVELEVPYAGSANLTAATSKVFYVNYAVPTGFRSLLELKRIGGGTTVRYVEPEQFAQLQDDSTGSGTPTHFTLDTKQNDTSKQIRMHPSPDAVYQYLMKYYRIGAEPSSDSDYMDWPDSHMEVLKKACLLALAEESKDTQAPTWRREADAAFQAALRDAAADDIELRKKRRAIGRASVPSGVNKRGYYTDGPITWL